MALLSGNRTPWIQTPLLESAALSKAAGCRILIKLENLQPSGSFKSRGLGLLIARAYASAPDPSKLQFYSSSGGNAGLGCVHAANSVSRPSTVVVPLSTKAAMIAKLRAAGAGEVVQSGANWAEADGYLREVVMKRAEARGEVGVYVPPFDHPDIWEGHASLVDEVAEQLGEMGEGPPDVVVCSGGGGGLLTGLAQGIETQGNAWAKTQILVMNTNGADALAKSLKAGEQLTLPGITSIATSLGATRVGDKTWEVARRWKEDGRLVSGVLTDAEAAMGCWRFADDERMMVEAACGVNLALCYGGRLEKVLGRKVGKEEKVVIVVCGGQNVSSSMIEGWRREYGDLDAGMSNGHAEDVPSAVTAKDGR